MSSETHTEPKLSLENIHDGSAYNPYRGEALPEDVEIREWIEALDYEFETGGPERIQALLSWLQIHAQKKGVSVPFPLTTPYVNTIPADKQSAFPGHRETERRIKSIIRWNAMAMVVRANRAEEGIGGHISTYASVATLFEIGFNHFFRGPEHPDGADMIYFQGHASPGIYARAFLEGRLSIEQLRNFRHELRPEGGLSSYPHPWLMPNFWQFPTVSMGLGPITAIYQARFNRYLENRSLKPKQDAHVWAFLGDGETDEPEALGAIGLAGREKLDNLIFVVNCNLQRLDGPVRGNGKIIQELETIFRGAGWNVIKLIWGNDWDFLLSEDTSGKLVKRMGEALDGDFQKYTVESGAYIREHFFGNDPDLLRMVDHLSDEQLAKMRRGGHDPEKVYAAYKAAVEHKGQPTVILAKTIKGYGLGEAGEGRNITHQQKKLNDDELRHFRTRFGIPISDEAIAATPFYKPPQDSPEMKYIRERREQMGGFVPARVVKVEPLAPPVEEFWKEFHESSGDREMSTTMIFVRILAKLLKDEQWSKLIVPIVPDEARTFGMEALFRQIGIYSSIGQNYEPVDRASLLYYKEAKDGQILEEGITEAGSMSSFIAAGTAYANHGLNMIPFFTFYSMFGPQRIGDLIWAAGDARCKGFMMGATAGRTTLNGEGLQHEDGHSHVLTLPTPNLLTYDPSFSYELALIIQDGMKRMYLDQEDVFYYLTIQNENYAHPAMPKGVEAGVLKGIYLYKKSDDKKAKLRVNLFGSGSIMLGVLEAQKLLAEKYGVAADVYSVTSYKNLYTEALNCDRYNMLNPTAAPKVPFITQAMKGAADVTIAASDFMKTMPDLVRSWVPGEFHSLGTDGYGRSESREALRDHFEVSAPYIVLAALHKLAAQGKLKPEVVAQHVKDFDINSEKLDPWVS
ncbi:MAG: pyruvate dehydrogenase (acetyl-transferring), homodimeric type [bacterium]|nr:pyruvate dehydrogenase (acetyl-transferring), homodimeric type [bacterium]